MLFLEMACSRSSAVMPRALSLWVCGSTSICVPNTPLISTRATCGSCSIRLLTISLAKTLSSRNFSTEHPSEEMFMKNAGMSVALAFITLGRSTSLRREESTLSIFSLTSMKLRSMSDLWLNSINMVPLPLTASQRISCNAGIWISCILSGLITCSFISLAEEPLSLTCTVICGISTSGIREMGSLPMATIPTMSIATIVMETAIGLSTSFPSINGKFSFLKSPHQTHRQG